MAYRPNVGGIDLILRAGFGLTTIYLAFINQSIIPDPLTRWVLGFLGVVFILTVIFRFCPFYRFISFNSTKHESDDS